MALNLCDLWIPQPKYYAPEYFRQWVSLKNINFKETFFLFIFDNFWITEKLMLNLWRLNTPPKSFYFLWVQCRILVKNWEKNWLLQKEFYPIVYISLQTTWNILICRWHLHWKIIWISKLKKNKKWLIVRCQFCTWISVGKCYTLSIKDWLTQKRIQKNKSKVNTKIGH